MFKNIIIFYDVNIFYNLMRNNETWYFFCCLSSCIFDRTKNKKYKNEKEGDEIGRTKTR